MLPLAPTASSMSAEVSGQRAMVHDGLCREKMAIGTFYRTEPAEGLRQLGYGIEKTHADGRFEIARVQRDVTEAFSTRRAEIEAAMAARGLGPTADNPHLAARAILMTRAPARRGQGRAAGDLEAPGVDARVRGRGHPRERPAGRT